jgi:hypothetical protein
MIKRYTIAWLGLVLIMILNGTIRNLVYGPLVSELTAHQISSVTGVLLTGLFTWLLSLKWRIQSERQALAIGSIWLVLTIVFEFIFGHYVMGHPWSRLLYDYNLIEGRVWSLVLIFTMIAPYIIYKMRS